MRRNLSFLVLLLVLAGCQSPAMNGGFYQSPYRGNGIDGPGPGVVPDSYQPVSLSAHDTAAPSAPAHMPPLFVPTSQINFLGLESLTIHWDANQPGAFDSAPFICPATHDFVQGNIYRLKLTDIPGHPGKELYPTLEIAPTAARTQAFLAHSSVPIEFTDNDFDQVFSGNFVTKVVYLPNPEFQGIAMSGVGTLVNTQLQPGVDPIVEASKRGSILAVIRMGNKDLSTTIAERQQWISQQQTAFGGGMMYPTNGTSIPQNMIAGVNIPPYGVPMTKTTTGVPGPPQLPQDMHYLPNRSPILRTEPIPAPPIPRAYQQQPQVPQAAAPAVNPQPELPAAEPPKSQQI
jgi:hypothetical protein